jgi:hypothetical protein
LYRPSAAAQSEREEAKPNVLEKLVSVVFLLAYFTFLPVIMTILLNWAAYSITAHNFYQEIWMMPLLLLLATFLAGALIRQKIEDEMGGLGLFSLGILALAVFSFLTYCDIHTFGGVYSSFMPKFLLHSVTDYVFMLPGVGIIGMLAYKAFTLKHYS